MAESVYSPEEKAHQQIVAETRIPDHAIRRFARFLFAKLQDTPKAIPPSDESPGE